MRTLTIAAVVMWTGIAQAKPILTYKTDRPGNEIIYGCATTYMVERVDGMVRSMIWECAHPGKPFVPMGGVSYARWRRVAEVIPGDFVVRCTITYYPDRATRLTPEPDVPTLNITIPPPDGVDIVRGDRTITRLGYYIPVFFLVTCKQKPVCNAFGFAQEQITSWRIWEVETILRPFWVPWVSDYRFALSGTTIVDLKIVREVPGWETAGVGPFSDSVQELRLLIPDLYGEWKEYPLETFDVVWKKVDDVSYTIEHTRR